MPGSRYHRHIEFDARDIRDYDFESYHSHKVNTRRRHQSQGSSCCDCISQSVRTAISLAVTLISATILWNMTGRPSWQDIKAAVGNFDVDDFRHVLGNITDQDWKGGFNEDPFGNSGGATFEEGNFQIWKQANGHDPLQLTLQNALDSDWQTEFDSAVSDWKESAALQLSVEYVSVDNSCTPVSGVMKVCNGNYGQTGWVGINEMSLAYPGDGGGQGRILSSVAKMNEYYLHNAAYTKRQYTMCHEIGNGFGLPHTDENMYNTDQGNCLDYTIRPESNVHPGAVNLERLEAMYFYNNQQQQQQPQQQQYYYQDDGGNAGEAPNANNEDKNNKNNHNNKNDNKNNNDKNNNKKNNNNNRYLWRRTMEEEEIGTFGDENNPERRVLRRYYLWVE